MMDIQRDTRRFKQIVRGRIRENLRKYITHGEMIGRKGRDIVSIPVPQLDVPRFRFGKNGSGGVGQGDGEVGDPVGKPGQGQGAGGGAGSEPGGGHFLEVEISLDELAEMLGDELELPRIEPKGTATIEAEKSKYNSIRQAGPESLRHFRRTYLRALRRQITTGEYEPRDPRVVPVKQDKQYRSWNDVPNPQVNAAVIYLMDVSGSMTDEQKEIVRTEAFWIDAWLGRQYRGVEKRYIIHDAAAKEVDERTFYHTRESGGTRISSAYKVAADLITQRFPPDDWNLYCFQFSDGDNWGDDNKRAFEILAEKLIPAVNLFCYGQVESPYGSGDFIDALEKQFPDHEKLVVSEIADKDAIYESIRTFLGKGK
jgi:sporulation protein YhbH